MADPIFLWKKMESNRELRKGEKIENRLRAGLE